MGFLFLPPRAKELFMKRTIYLLLLVLVQLGMAQNKTQNVPLENDNLIYNSAGIEVKPEFPGGMQAFYNFIASNYNTPNVKNLKGKVIISFIIEKDGTLTDIKVLRDIGFGTGEEAIRVLKACPKWTPAFQNGQTVRCSYQLPLNIVTEEEKAPAKTHGK